MWQKNHVKHRENLVKNQKTTGNRQNQKEDNPKLSGSILGVLFTSTEQNPKLTKKPGKKTIPGKKTKKRTSQALRSKNSNLRVCVCVSVCLCFFLGLVIIWQREAWECFDWRTPSPGPLYLHNFAKYFSEIWYFISWFAFVVIVFLEVVIGSIVFGQAVPSFFLPLVVLVWFLFFFRFFFWPKEHKVHTETQFQRYLTLTFALLSSGSCPLPLALLSLSPRHSSWHLVSCLCSRHLSLVSRRLALGRARLLSCLVLSCLALRYLALACLALPFNRLPPRHPPHSPPHP